MSAKWVSSAHLTGNIHTTMMADADADADADDDDVDVDADAADVMLTLLMSC